MASIKYELTSESKSLLPEARSEFDSIKDLETSTEVRQVLAQINAYKNSTMELRIELKNQMLNIFEDKFEDLYNLEELEELSYEAKKQMNKLVAEEKAKITNERTAVWNELTEDLDSDIIKLMPNKKVFIDADKTLSIKGIRNRIADAIVVASDELFLQEVTQEQVDTIQEQEVVQEEVIKEEFKASFKVDVTSREAAVKVRRLLSDIPDVSLKKL